MTWEKFLATNRIERHTTSKQELDDLRAAVKRNLHDSAIKDLSADNKFGLAYEAALLLAKIVLACSGYRAKGFGGHQTTLTALKLAMGPSMAKTATYLDRCRRKRNDLSYDMAGIITDAEAAEVLRQASKLNKTVEDWIGKNHPMLM